MAQFNTPADGIRFLAKKAIETGEPQKATTKQIAIAMIGKPVAKMSEDERKEMETLEEIVSAKLTRSYVSITINRMKEVVEIGKSASVKIGYDAELDGHCITVGLKDGAPKKIAEAKRAEYRQAFNSGIKRGLEMVADFVPDFVDFEPEEVFVAQKIIRMYREQIEKLMEGIE